MGADVRGLSPVVGVALLLVIVVALAATVGMLTTGVTDQIREPTPTVRVAVSVDADGSDNGGVAALTLTVEGGTRVATDRLTVVDDDGDRVDWTAAWATGSTLAPGVSIRIDGDGTDEALDCLTEGASYTVVWHEGESTRPLFEVTVEQSVPESSVDQCRS